MARYCIGEAAGAFNVKPTQILTLPVEDDAGGAYSVYGQYPQDGPNTTTFECRFGPKGDFAWVRTREEQKKNAAAAARDNDTPPNSAVRACSAVKDHYGEVLRSSPLKSG